MNYGYIKSALSASDIDAEKVIPKITLPLEYDLSKNLSGIRDQGSVSKCVSVALTDIVLWHSKFDNIKLNFKDDYFFVNRSDKSLYGMTPKEAFQILKDKGVSSDKGLYKKSTFAKVGSEIVMKNALISNGPVIIGLPVYSYDEKFWTKSSTLLGGHAVLIVGYNPNGFTIRNSWGYSYGSGGYSLLPYSDFSSIYEAWTLIN